MIQWLAASIRRFSENESGQGLVEYAFILVLVSTIAVVVLETIGISVSDLLDTVGGVFP